MGPSPYGLKTLCTFRKYPKDPSPWSLSSPAKVRQRTPASGSVKTRTHTYAKYAQVHTLRAYTHSHTYLYCNVQSHVHAPICIHAHTKSHVQVHRSILHPTSTTFEELVEINFLLFLFSLALEVFIVLYYHWVYFCEKL